MESVFNVYIQTSKYKHRDTDSIGASKVTYTRTSPLPIITLHVAVIITYKHYHVTMFTNKPPQLGTILLVFVLTN